MDMTSGDAQPAGLAGPGELGVREDNLGPDCHPHLFERSHAVAARVNRHLYKFLGFLNAVIESHPSTRTSTSHVWLKSNGTYDLRFTMTKTGSIFTWKMELKQVASTDYATVFSGTIDRTGVTAPHQGKGTM